MNTSIKITRCPTCGNDKIGKVCRDWTGEFQGQSYIVPSLEFYECSTCGEKIYDPKAMQKIESYSPAYAGTRPGTRSRAKAHAKADAK